MIRLSYGKSMGTGGLSFPKAGILIWPLSVSYKRPHKFVVRVSGEKYCCFTSITNGNCIRQINSFKSFMEIFLLSFR